MFSREKDTLRAPILRLFALAAACLVCSPACEALQVEDPPEASLYKPDSAEIAPDEYIVVLRDGIEEAGRSRVKQGAQELRGIIRHEYRSVLDGFSVNIGAEGLKALRRSPDVNYIEAVRIAHATGIETCPPWGLDVIDQVGDPSAPGPRYPNGVYSYAAAGAGVHVYVMDSGIQSAHSEFKAVDGGSRVAGGYCNQPMCLDTEDCQGHGTHLAAIVGGVTYGVAKSVTLHSVRIMSCGPQCGPPTTLSSSILDGLEWIKNNAQAPAVVLMGFSMAIGNPDPVYTAIDNLTQAGFVVVAAAGNDATDACKFTPGGQPPQANVAKTAITVGAFDEAGEIWQKSNIGKCIDIFAPGTNIPSALSDVVCGKDTFGNRSGTSQAAAHVAGVAALLLESGISGAAVRNVLINGSVAGSLTIMDPDSPDVALYALNGANGLTSPRSAQDMTVDEDRCLDGLACAGGQCEICPPGFGVVCAGLAQGGGITCDPYGNCDPCGAEGLACCPGPIPAQDFCAPGFMCAGGICSCGGLKEPCCGGVGGSCDEPSLHACHEGMCKECGLAGQPCCDGACDGGNLVCDSGQCTLCGLHGQPCCDGACDGDNLVCNSGQCTLCGLQGQPCCGGACDGDTLVCDSGQCSLCGEAGQPCCEGECNGSLDCDGTICGDLCGGPYQQCCPNYQCDGDMGCDYLSGGEGICKGTCHARCQDGRLAIPLPQAFPTEFDCTAWADKACAGHGAASRVIYNFLFVDNPQQNCGSANEACCVGAPDCSANMKCHTESPFIEEDIVYDNVKIGHFSGQQYCQ